MSKAKIVRLNLILATPKSVVELKQIATRLTKTPGIDKLEQIFPDAAIPILAAMCMAYVQSSKVDSVLKSLLADSDVKSAQIAPLRKVQKRKR